MDIGNQIRVITVEPADVDITTEPAEVPLVENEPAPVPAPVR
ncbi:MAG TPA: hypothetical protein VLG28_08015 [Acidimicrobiia bacterium]|jgi:hypothetical protein|nr:hypothetical protein [Acidimicrobiia bacterium]